MQKPIQFETTHRVQFSQLDPYAHIECSMLDSKGRLSATCLMTATCVDKTTLKGIDWPADQIARFYFK